MVGKSTVYRYKAGPDALMLDNPRHEHQYGQPLVPGTILARRSVFESIKYPVFPGGEERQLLDACRERGIKLYAADRFNFVSRQDPDKQESGVELPEHSAERETVTVAFTQDYLDHADV